MRILGIYFWLMCVGGFFLNKNKKKQMEKYAVFQSNYLVIGKTLHWQLWHDFDLKGNE